MVVATSAGTDEMNAILRQAGVADLIACRTSSDDAEESKPDPDIVVAALQRAGAPPEATVMIGDTPYDIEAARRAGVGASSSAAAATGQMGRLAERSPLSTTPKPCSRAGSSSTGAHPFSARIPATRRTRTVPVSRLQRGVCMPRLLAFLLLAAPIVAVRLAADVNVRDTRLLHQPAISGTHVAFVYADDLWVADLDGPTSAG